ncbi:MAG: hypothetical protein E7514_02590 [Ruminococcaceae bacterium]|nr:hypothetical protein [Oscillospiraceae bacterium]
MKTGNTTVKIWNLIFFSALSLTAKILCLYFTEYTSSYLWTDNPVLKYCCILNVAVMLAILSLVFDRIKPMSQKISIGFAAVLVYTVQYVAEYCYYRYYIDIDNYDYPVTYLFYAVKKLEAYFTWWKFGFHWALLTAVLVVGAYTAYRCYPLFFKKLALRYAIRKAKVYASADELLSLITNYRDIMTAKQYKELRQYYLDELDYHEKTGKQEIISALDVLYSLESEASKSENKEGETRL